MNEDKYIKTRHKKLDKHFVIFINSRKVKILKYKIYSNIDKLNNEEYQIIEIITKISNESLRCKMAKIVIKKEDSIIEIAGVFHGAFFQIGLSRYMFKIENYRETAKINN